MTEHNTVPCNGCAACCRRERIILRAEDDKALYVVIATRKGNDRPIEFMLPHKPNGDCYYLRYVGDGRSECSWRMDEKPPSARGSITPGASTRCEAAISQASPALPLGSGQMN